MLISFLVKQKSNQYCFDLGLFEPTYLFVPYIFVDNPEAMVGGREYFGIPKVLASNIEIQPEGRIQTLEEKQRRVLSVQDQHHIHSS